MNICELLLYIPPCIGLVFSLFKCKCISDIKINGSDNKINSLECEPEKIHKMKDIAYYVSEGSSIFLKKKYQYLSVFIVVFYIILLLFVNSYTATSFVIGCLTSILVGYIGVKIAVYTNLRATNEVCKSLNDGHKVTLASSAVISFALVSINIIILSLVYHVYNMYLIRNHYSKSYIYKVMAGFGLGSSTIALFSRVGGSIYAKAVNIGANLSGKTEYGIPENDLRNPACVSDNVGNVVGVSTELFGSLAESLCATLIIGSSAVSITDMYGDYADSIFLPLLFVSCNIIAGILSFFIISLAFKIRCKKDVDISLKCLLILSVLIQSVIIIGLGYLIIKDILIYNNVKEIHRWQIILPTLIGLWNGLFIGFITEFYTSTSYKIVQELAEAQKTSAASGIIYALSLGYRSTLLPIICLGITTGVSYFICDVYGVVLAANGILSTLCIYGTISTYGPIAYNSNEMTEIAGLSSKAKENAKTLDLAGNTASTIGNGFSIGSTTLVSFALFCVYVRCANIHNANILNPWILIGLFIGLTLPYLFSALTLRSVTVTAKTVLNECLIQFPLILSEKQKPDYLKCMQSSINTALTQTIAPGLIALFSPLIIGMLLGKNATAGLLIGIILSGVHIAVSSTNTGSALYNARKYVESGALGPNHSKGSNTHHNSIIGSVVGDPLKDTSVPSLNVLIKLPTIASVIFASLISKQFTSYTGDPIWLS